MFELTIRPGIIHNILRKLYVVIIKAFFSVFRNFLRFRKISKDYTTYEPGRTDIKINERYRAA